MNWKWRISHARGYRELGMLKSAAEELALVPKTQGEETDFLAETAVLSQEMGSWEKLAEACRKLAARQPQEAGWWIMWAYGTRRAESLVAAEKILLEAEGLHRDNATIQFNLGCYACQLGNFGAAQSRVARAIALDQHFYEMAQSDPDLDALRKIIAEPWK